jgi:hypothetical protein
MVDPRHFWNEERKQIVRKLWSSKSNQKIADIIGHGATRNAVSGIGLRMGLKKVPCEHKESKIRSKKYLTKAEKQKRKMPKPPSSIIRGEDVPPLLCSALELTSDNCAYPYGERNFKFCGRPRVFKSFCAIHAPLCYTPSKPREYKPSFYRGR